MKQLMSVPYVLVVGYEQAVSFTVQQVYCDSTLCDLA